MNSAQQTNKKTTGTVWTCPIDILVSAADESMDIAAWETLMHAIYYLRSGKYPFNRVAR